MGRIDIQAAPAWVSRLEGEMRKAAKKGLLSAGQRMVGRVVEIISQEPRVPVDRGIYRAAWRARAIPEGALVYNGAPHALPIEEGVKAGNVKIGRKLVDALASWVIRKGLIGKATKGAERAAQARSIAWAIAKQFQKTGIFNGGKGLRIMEKASKDLPRFIDEEVRRELRQMRED